LVAFVEEGLLDDGQLGFQDAEEAGVHGGHANLLADLQVFVKEHFLAHGPTDVHSAEGQLVGGYAIGPDTVYTGLDIRELIAALWQKQGQFSKEHKVHEVVL
jgi:hypothetical protein